MERFITLRTACLAVGMAVAIGLAGLASAAAPQLGGIQMFIFGDKLENVIREVVRSRKVSLKISSKVEGYISNRNLSGTQQDVLDALGGEFNYEWFEHNGTLYVSSRQEATTRVIELGELRGPTVLDALRNAGLETDRFPIRVLQDNKTMVLSGPPSYVALSEAIVQSLRPPKGEQAAPALSNIVTIYRGMQRESVAID